MHSADYVHKVTVNFDGNPEGAINNKLGGFIPFFSTQLKVWITSSTDTHKCRIWT